MLKTYLKKYQIFWKKHIHFPSFSSGPRPWHGPGSPRAQAQGLRRRMEMLYHKQPKTIKTIYKITKKTTTRKIVKHWETLDFLGPLHRDCYWWGLVSVIWCLTLHGICTCRQDAGLHSRDVGQWHPSIPNCTAPSRGHAANFFHYCFSIFRQFI